MVKPETLRRQIRKPRTTPQNKLSTIIAQDHRFDQTAVNASISVTVNANTSNEIGNPVRKTGDKSSPSNKYPKINKQIKLGKCIDG